MTQQINIHSSVSRFIRYGILGVPLAYVGLPVYVHVPKFYAESLHMDLGLLGSVLLILRLFDTVLDPFIGIISDRFRHFRRRIMAVCVPLLAGSYVALFAPPAWGEAHVLAWLALCLAAVYLSYSTLMINYYALGVELADGYDENTRISAWREGSMLVGVLLASLLPALLMQKYNMRETYFWFSLSLAPLLALCAWIALSVRSPVLAHHAAGVSFARLLQSAAVRWVLVIALFNAIPTAITSTLFLFFTDDVLHAGQQSGPMLAVYFLSAAACMPLWTSLSRRYSKRVSLLAAMAMAIASFIWAWQLGSGDFVSFYSICILSGMTLGADAALLPSLFADTLADKREASGAAFGLWNLTSKLTMALAAGIALPILAASGYHPGEANTMHALRFLSFSYALLPCAFKALAALLLYCSPVDAGRKQAA